MRLKSGTLGEVFHIHKMWMEFLKDTGQPWQPHEKDAKVWLYRFSHPQFFCSTVLHGRRYVGMLWGYAPDGLCQNVRVEGVFIKRGFRGARKPLRLLLNDLQKTVEESGAVAVSSVVPENLMKSAARKGFRVSSVIVEKTVGGRDGK